MVITDLIEMYPAWNNLTENGKRRLFNFTWEKAIRKLLKLSYDNQFISDWIDTLLDNRLVTCKQHAELNNTLEELEVTLYGR